MTSLKEKQVDKVLDRIIGDADEALKVITKLALMNKEITPEIVETLQMLKQQNEEDAKALHEEMELTLDASGNLVPVSRETYVSPTTPSALTYTITDGVINNVNGVISTTQSGLMDCGGNLVNDVVYRLPVGKT